MRWAVWALGGCLMAMGVPRPVFAQAPQTAPMARAPMPMATPAVTAPASAQRVRPTDTMAQRVLACTACHGAEGRATPEGYHPRIAGKPAGYLHQQLRHFRDGLRRHTAMQMLLQPLTDAYLGEIAAHFAALDLPYPPPAPVRLSQAQRARGEQLVRAGDPGRGLPACADCHGTTGMGREPSVPGLLGLPADYLAGQLGAWRTGARRTAQPDCMATLAQRLAPEDVAAVAGWLAAQPVPVGARPEAARPAALPLSCSTAP